MLTPTLDRAMLLVLDGVGCGALPDAVSYGPPEADPQANCLANVAKVVGGLALPHLGTLGIGNITPIAGTPPATQAQGAWGRMAEASAGKDSTTGHWEIAGLVTSTPFPTYPHGFPPKVIAAFEAAIGHKTLGNYPASGTVIIQDLGAEHLRTGFPIVYTSADSVFQIAAHEDITPLDQLYAWCAIARDLLTPPHNVGRVIARPFTGKPGAFTRLPQRRDFAVAPPGPTLLTRLRSVGYDVIGLGKIGDLFSEQGLSASVHPESDAATMALACDWLDRSWRGLLFVNLVECDQQWGHRRNPAGYAQALRAIDAWLPQVTRRLDARTALFITGDHGTDPTVGGTDHTREYVPVLATGGPIRAGRAIGTRASFADLGATIATALGCDLGAGASFWQDII